MELKLQEARPRLRKDTVLIQLDRGTFVKTDAVEFVLSGKSIYGWLSALAPHLTGEQTVDEICAGLEPDAVQMVHRLIGTLLDRGVVRDHVPERSGLLPAEVRDRFDAQISYLEHLADHPRARFKSFRECRLLVAGGGKTLTAVVTSLLANGLREISIAPREGTERVLHTVDPALRALHGDGLEASVNAVAFGELHPVLDRFDAVVYAADHARLREVHDLHQACWQAGRPFLAGVSIAGRYLIGPWVEPPHGPCWQCALIRYAANAGGQLAAVLWQEMLFGGGQGHVAALPAPVAQMHGNALAFELFRSVTGVAVMARGKIVVIQEDESLETRQARLLPYPLCPICSRSSPDGARAELMQALDTTGKGAPGGLVDRFYDLVDDAVGVCHAFADEEIDQLPIKVARIVVAPPVSSLVGKQACTAFGLDTLHDARDRAFARAVAHYAQAMLDRRATYSACIEQMQVAGLDVVVPASLSTYSGTHVFDPGQEIEWLPAYSALAERVRYVPAAAVHPASVLNRLRAFEAHGAAVAADTFLEALEKGLLAALACDQVRAILRGRGVLQRLDPASLPPGSDAAYLYKTVRRFGQAVDLLRAEADSPLPVVVACAAGQAGREQFTMGAGVSEVTAAQEALLELVGRLQLDATGDTTCEPRDPIPGLWLDVAQVRADSAARPFEMEETATAQALARLRDAGYDVLFANTTPRDLLDGGQGPVSGVVLLAYEGPEGAA